MKTATSIKFAEHFQIALISISFLTVVMSVNSVSWAA